MDQNNYSRLTSELQSSAGVVSYVGASNFARPVLYSSVSVIPQLRMDPRIARQADDNLGTVPVGKPPAKEIPIQASAAVTNQAAGTIEQSTSEEADTP